MFQNTKISIIKKLFIFLFFLSIIITNAEAQPPRPPANPLFNEYIKKVSPENRKFLPIFLMKYSPEKIANMSNTEITNLFENEFNKFVSDSGAYYEKFTIESNFVEPGRFTAEKMMQLKRVGEPKISPDGKWILYTIVQTDIEANKTNKDIYISSVDGKEQRRLTSDPGRDDEPCWSPDGNWIAFISTREGSPQIYIMDLTGSQMKKITDYPGGVGNIAWSPDGKYFSFTADVKIAKTVQEQNPDLPKVDVRMYDKLPVRHWDEWEDESASHLFIIPADGGTPIDLMAGEKYECPVKPFGGAEEIAWSPDSKEIAYTSKKVNDYALSTNSDIFIVPVSGGAAINISSGMPGFDKAPLYSPDGNWIAFNSQQRAGFESDRIRLMLYNRNTKEVTELSKTVDQWVDKKVWHPDSKSIFFNAEEGATNQIYNININDGKWKIITKGQFNHDGGIDIAKDGKTIVFARRNMLRPFEIYSMPSNGGEPKKITSENDIFYFELKLPEIKERWITSKDGKKFHTWVLYPPNFDPKKKYPMITYCQGGPQSTISQYFSLRWNLCLMASSGYVVVAPNRRGVPGFGQEWNDAISKDWGGMPMQDILAATDEVSAEPYIDKKGLAAVGASAGGYAVFWLEGNHNKRFSAFVSHAGVFNLESMYGSTEELWFPNWENGGPYWEEQYKEYYKKHSPHQYINNWDTPILISAGENDFRVPYTQALEAFTAAQLKGLPSKLIIWNKQNHWILKPQEQILWYKEFFKFLDKYCKH